MNKNIYYIVSTKLYNKDTLIAESVERYERVSVARRRYLDAIKNIQNTDNYKRKITLTREVKR